MPRETTQRLTPRAVPQVAPPQAVNAKAAATATDALPAYIPQQRDPTLQGLLEGLSSISPAIMNKLQEVKEDEAGKAVTDRLGGVEAQSDSANYQYHYLHTDGLVKGQQDATSLWSSYQTEFDKDGGNLEQFLADKYKEQMNGAKDGPFLRGYNKPVADMLENIRKTHLDYQRKTVETRAESNTMQLMDNVVGAFVRQDTPIPEDYLENLEKTTGKHLGVSQQRFQELLFETVKRAGDEGHFTAFDLLKKPRSDGSPGLYYDPKWKEKIDAAELHSYNVLETSSEKDRAKRYNEALYPVFETEDLKEATHLFKALKEDNLFKGDAEALIKWERLLVEKVDGKPDITQMTNEGEIHRKVLTGGITYTQILDEEARGRITSSQRKDMFRELRRVQTENRQIAAQEGKAEEAIYKTKEFGSAMDYVEGVLRPRPRDTSGLSGQADVEFDHMQLAQARREFFTKSKGKSPADLQDLADDVAGRYLKRRQSQAQGGMTDKQKEAVTQGKVPYKTLQELRANAHLHSTAELRQFMNQIESAGGQ